MRRPRRHHQIRVQAFGKVTRERFPNRTHRLELSDIYAHSLIYG